MSNLTNALLTELNDRIKNETVLLLGLCTLCKLVEKQAVTQHDCCNHSAHDSFMSSNVLLCKKRCTNQYKGRRFFSSSKNNQVNQKFNTDIFRLLAFFSFVFLVFFIYPLSISLRMTWFIVYLIFTLQVGGMMSPYRKKFFSLLLFIMRIKSKLQTWNAVVRIKSKY